MDKYARERTTRAIASLVNDIKSGGEVIFVSDNKKDIIKFSAYAKGIYRVYLPEETSEKKDTIQLPELIEFFGNHYGPKFGTWYFERDY